MSARDLIEHACSPRTDTPEFRQWFGQSKVVDANGCPARVYHGTVVWEKGDVKHGDFSQFDRLATRRTLGRSPGMDQVGSWFSSTPDGAELYGDAVYPVYLRIERPWVTTWDGFMSRGQQLSNWKPTQRRKIGGRMMTDNVPPGRWDPEKLREHLKALGYDGIFFPASERIDGKDHAVWVAFEPEQIKSAISNRGAWDPKSADIRESEERVDRAALLVNGAIVKDRRDSTHAALRSIVARTPGSGGIEDYAEGFVSSLGRFLSRQEAYALARAAGQVSVKKEKDLEAIDFARSRSDVKDWQRFGLRQECGDARPVYYHGTHKDSVFTQFNPIRPGARLHKNGTVVPEGEAVGIYFTDTPKGTENYNHGRLIRAHLRMENPYVTEREWMALLTKRDLERLKRLGYDSVIWDRHGAAPTEYIVFDPEQVEIIGADVAESDGARAVIESEVAELTGEKIDAEWTEFAEDSGTLGIPRKEMPQIKSEHRGALVQFLKGRDISSSDEEVLPTSLKPTQREYSPGKVDKARKHEGDDRAILVSADDHVVDGHHQWMAKLTDSPEEKMRVIRLAAPIKKLLDEIAEFPSVEQDGGAKKLKEAVGQPSWWISRDGELEEVDTDHAAWAQTHLNQPIPEEGGEDAARDDAIAEMFGAGWRRVVQEGRRIYVNGAFGWRDLSRAQRETLEYLAAERGCELWHDRKVIWQPPVQETYLRNPDGDRIFYATHGWLGPAAEWVPFRSRRDTHEELAREHWKMPPPEKRPFGNYDSRQGFTRMWSAGWMRVVPNGPRLIAHFSAGTGRPTERQLAELKNRAIENDLDEVMLDNNNSYRTVWSRDDKMEEAAKPVPSEFKFGRDYWIDPSGRLFHVSRNGDDIEHDTWAVSVLKVSGKELSNRGWRRLVSLIEDGGRRVIYVRDDVNRAQRAALELAAIESNAWLIQDNDRMRSGLVTLYQPPDANVGEALKIRVPSFAQRDFFTDYGAPEEFWAMRSRPKTKAGEAIEFFFGQKQVATAQVSRVEGPGQSSCGHSGKFQDKWKVHWKDATFRRVNEAADGVQVWRGVNSSDGTTPREGYQLTFSSRKEVADSYAMDGQSKPFILRGELVEFPVRNGDFDKLGFDRRAQTLKPGQILVARGVYDPGPWANEERDPKLLYTYASDIYATRDPSVVKAANVAQGAIAEAGRYIGVVDPDGTVRGERSNMSHTPLGFSGPEDRLWRYRPDVQEVFWWAEPSIESKADVEAWLEKRGRSVKKHVVMGFDPALMSRGHGA